jgi:hypothetical protein
MTVHDESAPISILQEKPSVGLPVGVNPKLNEGLRCEGNSSPFNKPIDNAVLSPLRAHLKFNLLQVRNDLPGPYMPTCHAAGKLQGLAHEPQLQEHHRFLKGAFKQQDAPPLTI